MGEGKVYGEKIFVGLEAIKEHQMEPEEYENGN